MMVCLSTFPYVSVLCQSNHCSSSLIAIEWGCHWPHPYVQCYNDANPRDSKPYRGEGQPPGPGVTRPCSRSVTREKLAPGIDSSNDGADSCREEAEESGHNGGNRPVTLWDINDNWCWLKPTSCLSKKGTHRYNFIIYHNQFISWSFTSILKMCTLLHAFTCYYSKFKKNAFVKDRSVFFLFNLWISLCF